jgi:hypothetical protein
MAARLLQQNWSRKLARHMSRRLQGLNFGGHFNDPVAASDLDPILLHAAISSISAISE